jgi:hypothetical protein
LTRLANRHKVSVASDDPENSLDKGGVQINIKVLTSGCPMEFKKMEHNRRKMTMMPLIHKYRFHPLVLVMLRSCLCVCIASLLVSCGDTVPKQSYLASTSLSGISRVALVVSATPPKVSYSLNSQNAYVSCLLLLSITAVVPAMLEAVVENAVRSGEDRGHAEKMGKHVNLTYLEDKLAQSFIQPLRGSPCFQTIDYVTDKKQDDRQLSAAGYNAVIRLSVRELSLDRIGGDNVTLHIFVHGEMKYLSSDKIVWNREEYIESSESHSLAYYRENGLKELDVMIEKAGRKFAYEFIYLK